MRALWLLTRLRMLEIVRVPSTRFLFFGLPLVLLVLTGVIFANGHPFERRRLAVVGNPGLPALAAFPEIRVQPVVSVAEGMGQLKAHMASAVLAQEQGVWTLTVSRREQLFGRGLQSVLLPEPGLVLLDAPRWGFVHYVFPGILSFSVVMSGLFGLGYYMLRYRQNLFLRKLSTTPLRKETFLAAQVLGRALLGCGQSLLLLLGARLCFGLAVTTIAVFWTLVVTLLGLLVFLGVGLLLATWIRTEGIMYDAISALGWPVVLLSETFFPVDDLPGPLPQLAGALPSTQLVRLLREVLLYQQTSATALLPGLAVLAAWAVGTFALALWLFRWND